MKSSRPRRRASRTKKRSATGSRRASTRSRRTSGSTTTAPPAREPGPSAERVAPEAAPILERLRHALQALALPPETQARLLPVFVAEADELALSFEHCLGIARADSTIRLSRAQRDALSSVEGLLDAMSGQALAHLWTREALRNGEAWSRLRQAAGGALRSFGWRLEVPPGRLFEYIEW